VNLNDGVGGAGENIFDLPAGISHGSNFR